MLSTAEYQNPPVWMCFLLICSSVVAETNSCVPLLFPSVSWKSLSWCCLSPTSLTCSDFSMNIFSRAQTLSFCAELSSSCSSESFICPDMFGLSSESLGLKLLGSILGTKSAVSAGDEESLQPTVIGVWE